MRGRVYYGWWVVLATFWVLFVCAGIGFHSFPVFLKYIEADAGWSRGDLSFAAALAAIAAGLATPAVGYAVDRFGARAVMAPGAILMSISFMLLGHVGSLSHLYFLFVIMGIGMTSATVIPSQTLVSRWFKRERGRAMGVVSVGGSFGGIVWLPVMSRLIEAQGWRNAYEILGVIVIVVALPLILLVIRKSPQSMGMPVDGPTDSSSEDTPSVVKTLDEGETGHTLREALGTVGFWLILLATFLGGFAGSGFGLHAISFLSDSGLSSGRASSVWSITIAVSIGSVLFFGVYSETRQKRYLAAGANVFRAFSMIFLVLLALKLVSPLVAITQLVIIYGFSLGCNIVTGPLLISETFGVKSFGKVAGLIGIPFTIGMALGMVVGGRLYDLRQNYNLAFLVFAAALILAGIAIAFVKPYFLVESKSPVGNDED